MFSLNGEYPIISRLLSIIPHSGSIEILFRKRNERTQRKRKLRLEKHFPTLTPARCMCFRKNITITCYISQQLEDNTAVSLCDCDKEKYKTTSDDTDNEKIEKKIALKSKCQAMVDGMPLFGTRTDICEKGKMPETRSQREEKIRQVEHTTYVHHVAVSFVISFPSIIWVQI